MNSEYTTTNSLDVLRPNHQLSNCSSASVNQNLQPKTGDNESKIRINSNYLPSEPVETFKILNHINKLQPAKGKNRYICPVCDGNNLTIEPNTGKYQCWSGCQCSDIREAISPWSQVHRLEKAVLACDRLPRSDAA